TTDDQCPARAALRVEVGAGDSAPATLFAGLAHAINITGTELLNCLLQRRCDVADGVNADFELVGRISRPPAGLTVQVHERTEATRISTDDRNHQRQSECTGSREGARRSPNAQPDRQWVLQRPWVHALPDQTPPEFAGP